MEQNIKLFVELLIVNTTAVIYKIMMIQYQIKDYEIAYKISYNSKIILSQGNTA